jgi:mono/diheme cytochrome c family protein
MKRSLWVGVALAAMCVGVGTAQSRMVLHKVRQSASDLEIGGALIGVPRGEARFVTYRELLALPQESYTVSDDTNFGRTLRISGVGLGKLAALVGAAPEATMVTAICNDAYVAHYPAEYLGKHHPVLVLRVDGKALGAEMGPYLVSHARFTPAFQVLGHKDEAQVPWGVVRVDFRSEREVYTTIAPFGARAEEVQVQQGYAIARQNCFRCHSRAGEGGGKANRTWEVVGRRAATDPQWFDGFVRNPKRVNAAAEMPGNPGYDEATMRALRAYLELFAESAR